MHHFSGGSLSPHTHPHANPYSLYVLERVYKRPKDPKQTPHTAKTTIAELLDSVAQQDVVLTRFTDTVTVHNHKHVA